MEDFLQDWDLESLGSWAWVLGVAGSVAAAYLIYKAVKILRTDCDLTLMNKTLKAGYFKGKVVWVTGASSGSKCCMQKCIEVSYVVLSVLLLIYL